MTNWKIFATGGTFVFGGILMLLCSYGAIGVYEKFSSAPFATLPFDDRWQIPMAGISVALACLMFLVTCLRVLLREEVVSAAKGEMDRHWNRAQKGTQEALKRWVMDQDWTPALRNGALEHLSKMPVENTLRH